MLTYIKESIEELRNHVTLPTKAESSNLMVVVAVFSILFALATWGVDEYFSDLISGDLFSAKTYSDYLDAGFGGIVRLLWYAVLTVGLVLGISSFTSKNKNQ